MIIEWAEAQQDGLSINCNGVSDDSIDDQVNSIVATTTLLPTKIRGEILQNIIKDPMLQTTKYRRIVCASNNQKFRSVTIFTIEIVFILYPIHVTSAFGRLSLLLPILRLWRMP